MRKNKNIETRLELNMENLFSKFSLETIGKHMVKKDYKFNCSERTKENFILFQLTISGYGVFIKDNVTYICKKDDMFCCEIPSETIYYLPINSDSWEVLYLEISSNFYELFKKIVELNDNKYVINLKNHAYIKTLLFEMYNISLIDRKSLELEKLFFMFIVELFNMRKKENTLSENIIGIKNYIESNYEDNISLDDLSNKFFISKAYLIKKFKEETKLTPIEYLNEYRLNIAKDLLLKSNNKIEYIASTVGFNNSNYFTKVFKKKFKMTPREYRKNKFFIR